MFLEWIAKLEFETPDPESGIFLHFPIATRETIAKQICDCILGGAVQVSTAITSCAHMKVIMECTGQAFGLPMSSG